jgi:anaerobic selenocysteine-containing dehydrogenase
MSEKSHLLELTRREFLKTSAATAALVTIGDRLFDKPMKSLFDKVDSQVASGSTVVHSYCKMCIGPTCGILATVTNGVVTQVMGDPAHPANEGKLCPRGNSNIYNLYNPYRLKAPLKRTNPDKSLTADPGWVEISWDEAMSTVKEKLGTVLKQDPRGLIFHLGFGSMRDDSPMARPVFPTAFGTPNEIESNGPLCPVHFGALSNLGSFTYSIDPTRTNYLVVIGHSLGGDFARASEATGLHGVSTEALQNALDRGLKMIVVNPHAGAETIRGEWVPILPGTELPFIMAMTNVILFELNKYDEWFLRVRTNAPYLIGQDGDYVRDPHTKKPLVWNKLSNQPAPFDDPQVNNGLLSDPSLGAAALTGSYQVNGVTVSTAFDVIKEHYKQYTPEWAEGITKIPAATIRRIATDLVNAAQIGSTIDINGVTFPYRPALVFAGRGAIAHRGGANVMLAVNLINGLIGATDVPGGLTGESFNPLPQPGADGTVEPNPKIIPQSTEWIGIPFKYPPDHLDMAEFFPHRHCTPYIAWRTIVNPEKYHINYKPQAMLLYGANPLTNNIQADEAIAAFKAIPFFVTISYHLDEPTQFADIVLAESANMERLNFFAFQACGPVAGKRGMQGVNVKTPVVNPLYNTRDSNSILLDLANQLGLNPPVNGMLSGMLGLMKTPYALVPPKQYTWEQVVDNYIKATFGADKDANYFKENGSGWTVKMIPEEKTYNYYYFPDGKTRHPIYLTYLLKTGTSMKENLAKANVTVPGWDMDKYMAFYGALPTWIPHPEHEAPAEFDLFAVNWKIASRAFGMGALEELAPVREMQMKQSREVNSILINVDTARSKGIQDGDQVVVESQYGGKIEGPVMTTSLIHPSVLGFPGNFGRRAMFLGPDAREGLNYNQLLSAEDGNFDPVVGGIEITAAVKITKA